MSPLRSVFSNFSLAVRVMLGAGVFLVLATAASIYTILGAQEKAFLAERAVVSGNRAARNAERMGRSIGTLQRDVLFLSHTPPVQGIVRATRHRGRDPEANLGAETWISRLQEIFSAFAGSRPEYYQMRYIGVAGNGRELVRVDVEDGRTVVMPAGKLQSKVDRDYFQATAKLK